MATINQLPSEQRPREKLANDGAQSLSDAELIAIFLRTGLKGESAIEIGNRLIAKFGSLTSLGQLDAKELSKERGLGLAKASQLLACFELGARVAKEELRKEPLNEPQAIAEFLRPIIGYRKTECLLVLAVDNKLRLIQYKEVSSGTVDQTLAHPREILRPVILNQAAGFFLAHNHPSGDPRPSNADRGFTEKIKNAASLMSVSFHDHLIIGQPCANQKGYYSFSESGALG